MLHMSCCKSVLYEPFDAHRQAHHHCSGDDMPPFDVRCVRVEKTKRPEHTQETAFEMHTFSKQQQTGSAKDRSQTAMTPGNVSPPVKARSSGPLSWVTLLGSFLSLSLLIISITLGDGMSLIATILLSGLSTLIGYSNKWELKLPQPPKGSESAQGDVVIRYPNGSYLIVKCNEEVARELYFAPEEVRYNLQNETVYRMISLVGTLMLMLGVIFLANAKLQLQFCWGGAYIILNAAHWVAAALPQKLHWDLSCYSVEEEGVEPGPNNQTFTDALFKAILFTKSKDWARIGKPAAPATKVWDEWLQEAEDQALEIKDNGTQLGNIRDPWWATHQGSERGVGIVWKMPTDWKPRAAFARLNKKAGMEEGHGVPVNQPVTTPGAAHTW